MTVHEQPSFVLLPAESWRRFECVVAGSFSVTLTNGAEHRLDFPRGWRTDMTTTPRLLLWALPQLGPHVPASVAHDRALDLWRVGQLSLDEAREIGFTVVDSLAEVGPLSRFFWKAGVWVKDKILRPLGV